MIDYHVTDRNHRRITLGPVSERNWEAVADVVPRDDQRGFVAPSAARYLLLAMREGVWQPLAVLADGNVVGHVMWAWDEEDQRYWIGGVVVNASEQGMGVGMAAMRVLLRWLFGRPDCQGVRLSCLPTNLVAHRMYNALGFDSLGLVVDGEEVLELTADRAAERLTW